MLAAIKELCESRADQQKEHLAVFNYLEACNFIFERGILSNEPIKCPSSPTLANIEKGCKFFSDWKSNLAVAKEGTYTCNINFIIAL